MGDIRLVVVAATLMSLSMSVHAEPGPTVRWLMNNPLTLFDHGMMTVEKKAEEAATNLAKSFLLRGGQLAGTWTDYSWENNEISILLSVTDFPEEATHANCNEIRGFFIALMTGFLPKDAVSTEYIGDVIGDWFSHRGFQRTNRDEELSEKLARITFVGVELTRGRSILDPGLICRARITEPSAPSKPS